MRRVQEYAETQHAYTKRRSELARNILDGTWKEQTPSLTAEKLTEFWKPLLESNSDRGTAKTLTPDRILSELCEPITTDHIVAALRGVSGSPGPDGVTWNILKARKEQKVLVSLFNLWLWVERCPLRLCKGITTLIPKEAGTQDASKYRPITVTSVLGRLFHKILAKRMDTHLPLGERQKGFRPGDGLGFNVTLLREMLRKSTDPEKPTELALVFLDVRKAFDSVNHSALFDVCEEYGVPSKLLNYLKRVYAQSTTRLKSDGIIGDETIKVAKGVKQGDPLSCALFNTVIDRCLKSVDDSLGVKLDEDLRISKLAFADDVVLLAESPKLLQRLTTKYCDELALRGLQVNPSKCASLYVKVSKSKSGRLWYVPPKPCLKINAEEIPHMGIAETYRYLGIALGPEPSRDAKQLETTSVQTLTEGLKNLSLARLKPQQRMYILRQHLLPRLLHRFTLGKPYCKTLKKCDILIRKSVSKWLHLPKATSTPYFHAPVKAGGLGVMKLLDTIPVLRERREDRKSVV